MAARPLEITDLLWDVAADGERRPVLRARAVAALRDRGQRAAARLVERMPAPDGVLDPAYVDALAVRVHCELQRLEEELQFADRVAEVIGPHVERIREEQGAVRVVDVGCGIGYVVRALAARRPMGDVELVGVDLNSALLAAATRLATQEGLDCRFVRGDAFAPGGVVADGSRTIVISSGVLHHLPVDDLVGFFAAQARLGVAVFAHWDIAPCLWSTLGAWLFHRGRMREPVSRHDGVLSARRAHPAPVLGRAAVAGAPGYAITVLEGTRWHPRAVDVLRPAIGVRR